MVRQRIRKFPEPLPQARTDGGNIDNNPVTYRDYGYEVFFLGSICTDISTNGVEYLLGIASLELWETRVKSDFKKELSL
jgi:hypothetical protein